MKLNSKGQVTIPAELRRSHGFVEGDDVEVIADGATLRIVHTQREATRGQRVAARMHGRASTTASTAELMQLLRGE